MGDRNSMEEAQLYHVWKPARLATKHMSRLGRPQLIRRIRQGPTLTRERVRYSLHSLRHLHSANPKTGPSPGLFLYVSKGFAGTIRSSETGQLREIGLRMPTISFHLPCALGEAGSKHPCISRSYRNRGAPLFLWFRLVSMKSEARHGRRGRWYVLGVLREVSDDKRSFGP